MSSTPANYIYNHMKTKIGDPTSYNGYQACFARSITSCGLDPHWVPMLSALCHI